MLTVSTIATGPGQPAGLAARSGYRADVQGIRGLAVAVIVFFHAGLPLPGGFIGVDIFFVVSGFVITRTLLKSLTLSEGIDFASFYLGRIRRLLPALALTLTVVLLLSALFIPIGAQGITARTGAAAALVNANHYLIAFGLSGYFDAPSALNPLLHTWSLSVEEQFYLVFPALLLMGWTAWLRRRSNSPMTGGRWVLVIVAGASFTLAVFLSTRPDFPRVDAGFVERFDYYSALTRAWEFCAGALLVMMPKFRPMGRGAATALSGLGLLLLSVALIFVSDTVPYPGLATLLPVIGTVLLISVGSVQLGNPVSRALSLRPMTFMGDVSYSWYLWHWPLIVFAGVLWPNNLSLNLVVAAVSLGVAWLSMRLVENRFRFRRDAAPRATVILGLACVIIPLLAAGALEYTHRVVRRDASVNAFAMHIDSQSGCDSPEPLQRKPPTCTWTVPNPSGRAVLVGDSNGGQFSEGFIAGMNEAGLDATVATMSSCPFIDVTADREKAVQAGVVQSPECATFVAETMDDLRANPPALVVMASSSDSYVYPPQDTSDRAQVAMAAGAQAIWTSSLHSMIEELEAVGSAVAVVHPVPKFAEWGPYREGPFKEAAAIRVLTNGNVFNAIVSRDAALEKQSLARAAEEAALAGTGARAIDFFGTLCPGDPCLAGNGDDWTYRDITHISVGASYALSDLFREVGQSTGLVR